MDRWRLITDADLTAWENMAVDEAILASAECNAVLTPTLRLYGWNSPAISIGYMQDPAPFASAGIPLVRRITGGRAILHDAELTYSVVAPVDGPVFGKDINSAYSVLARCLVNALNDIGVKAESSQRRRTGARAKDPACFNSPSRHEITVAGKKISGSAQRRFKRAFLQHGSILLNLDEGLYKKVFNEEVFKKTACASRYADGSTDNLKDALQKSLIQRMSEGLGAEFVTRNNGLDRSEAYLRDALLREKYLKDDWNLRGIQSGLKTKGVA